MAIGKLIPSSDLFPQGRAELSNAEVERSAPTGINLINEDQSQLNFWYLREAYPFHIYPPLDGVLVKSFFDDYYNRIHIFPNPLDFGYISSDTARTFQVWNAYLTEQYLSDITITGADGLTISGGPVSNYWLVGLEAVTYTISTGIDGPATTEATYQFNFPGLTVAPLIVRGVRVVIFPYPANWKGKVIERLEWLTSISEYRDGTEQRARMRQNPRQTLEFEFLVHHTELQQLASLLFRWQGRALGVPLWFQGQRMASASLAGSNTFTLTTEGYEYQVGGSIVFYSNPQRYEVLTISAITETTITTATVLLNNWSAHSMVFPMRVAFIQGSPAIRRITGEVASGTVQFKSQQNLRGISDWPAIYKDIPVLEWEPQRKDYLEETWNRRIVELDYGVGQARVFDKDSFSTPVRAAEFWGVNRTKIAALRDVLHYAEGQWKAFWAPTYDRDLEVVEAITATSTVIIVKKVDFTKYVWDHPYRKHIRLQLRNGTVFYREVIGSDDVNTPVNTETLSVDVAFPNQIKVADIYMLSFLPLVRLASDAIEIGWETMTVANTTLPLRPVQDVV